MITQEALSALLSYDAETGVFRWRVARRRIKAGSVAGRLDSSGHVQITVCGRAYMAHQLAWLYMTGQWPTKRLDHRDGEPDNNRWLNLREATHTQNMQNTRLRADNKTGHKGVTIERNGKFRVSIKVNGKREHLGTYSSVETAAAVYMKAAKARFGEFARAS